MAECTVCGGRVHEYEDLTTTHGGETYRFCCDEHKEEFERAPATFR
ncbi:TRASH domain-containing protein [Halorussus sp. AFM4]